MQVKNHLLTCVVCQDDIDPRRAALGYRTCPHCGEISASKVRHTIVNMAKSNYIVVRDPMLLKGLNKYAAN